MQGHTNLAVSDNIDELEILVDVTATNTLKPETTYRVDYKSKPVYDFVKRFFDIVCSAVALVVLSPMFLVVGILIKAEDKGPVFFKQTRVGKNNKNFTMYKFRSMKAGKIEELLTPKQLSDYKREFKLTEDPRITKIGSFLRKTSIDELPQLINILNGTMSIVGPRPILDEELYRFYGYQADLLLKVKPGLTGYWQAYTRNSATYETGMRQQIEFQYISERSLVFDFKIIIKTIFRVLSRKDTY